MIKFQCTPFAWAHTSGPRMWPLPDLPCPECDIRAAGLKVVEVELRAAERAEDGYRIAVLHHDYDQRSAALRQHRSDHPPQ